VVTTTDAALPSRGTSRDRSDARDHVVAAARSVYRAKGVRRATMEDVARAHGTSRQTVYKLFLGRRELVEASVAARVGELADEITGGEWGDGADTVSAFVHASVTVIRRIREDAELRDLLAEGSPVTLHEALWLDEVRARGLAFWTAWFDRARAAGVLRRDLPESALSDWLQTIYASLILRDPLDDDGAREIVERFVLPSILTAGAPG
jgi:AcrR family transcriptional regulator